MLAWLLYLSSGAVKSTSSIEESLGTVTWDGGAGPRDLLVHSWIMFNAAGDVCPGPVILPGEERREILAQSL